MPNLIHIHIVFIDFTRLKLVQGKKEEEQKREQIAHDKLLAEGKAPLGKINESDITAQFDAADDADVVF